MSKAAKPKGRQLIIDADIMHAASGRENDLAIRCRDVLEAVQQGNHWLARTPAMRAEWENHASRYSLNWLRSMQSRGRLRDIEEADTGVAGALANLAGPAAELAIMHKDCHLLEAALAGGLRVISKDEAAYFHYCHAAGRITQIRKIMWASPVRIADGCSGWLLLGAPAEAKRRIGQRPHKNHPSF